MANLIEDAKNRIDALLQEACRKAAGAGLFPEGAELKGTVEIPKDILAIWANQWLAFMQWILFHPQTSRRRTDADRKKALELLLADDRNSCRLKKFARYASRPKRIAFAFVLLAAKGWFLPAKLFFHLLYYPLAERRH